MTPRLWQDWRNAASQRQMVALALPMIAANLSEPLLSLTQTTLAGHQAAVNVLGGVAAGNTLYLLPVSLLTCLRMALTGLVAQAAGRQDHAALPCWLWRGLTLAVILAAGCLALAWPLAPRLLDWLHPSVALKQAALLYLRWRLLGLPAALMNFAMAGWLIGCRRAGSSLAVAWITQGVQIIACLLLVESAGWGLTGLALGAVAGEYAGMLSGLVLCVLQLRRSAWPQPGRRFEAAAWRRLLAINRDIFLRSLALQAVFFALPWLGARQGDVNLAANTLLLNGLQLTAFVLDGLANALETLGGHAIGAQDRIGLRRASVVASGWAWVLSLVFSAGFMFAGQAFIALQTDLPTVRALAQAYLPWLVALPPVAVASYLLDGLFIGAGRARAMRNSMLLAAGGFFLLATALHDWGNTGLWLSFTVFMALRGISLGWIAARLWQRQAWFAR